MQHAKAHEFNRSTIVRFGDLDQNRYDPKNMIHIFADIWLKNRILDEENIQEDKKLTLGDIEPGNDIIIPIN
jgi:hypothetical protein